MVDFCTDASFWLVFSETPVCNAAFIILFVCNLGRVCSRFWLSVCNSVSGPFNTKSRGKSTTLQVGRGEGAQGHQHREQTFPAHLSKGIKTLRSLRKERQPRNPHSFWLSWFFRSQLFRSSQTGTLQTGTLRIREKSLEGRH